jgi:UV DNA damage endonuclease
MKIGYPCINRSIECSSGRSFRLKSFSNARFIETVHENLMCLKKIINFNMENGLLFFRITSDLIPFASHPICIIDWQDMFKDSFRDIDHLIKMNNMRISMHPDQFIVLNSPRSDVVKRSIAELEYHADVLDLLGLDDTAKIQLHVGGVYSDKNASINRFIETFSILPENVTRRLVIENDERSYSVSDCLEIHDSIGIPILFDVFHDSLKGSHMSLKDALHRVSNTWKIKDGIPMVDYSSPHPNKRFGRHAETIDKDDFIKFIMDSRPYDFDIMLEIKDKENSALFAKEFLKNDDRFVQ